MFSIQCDNITKYYKIYNKPSDRLKELIFQKRFHQTFTALESISFSVLNGEAIGIIGENGAGKSTLLKILAGILQPTLGSVTIRGRVAALLELGSGFHPEFSGRQNIYLNASLLGLTPHEIHDLEQDIIHFAQLENFIDRPVKTYSSGMYIRLAFSIATSVNPDILVIDEALSVGDQQFQKKCIDRMMNFRKQNKTIVFCSHSMYHVAELCDRAIWICGGKIQAVGNKHSIISSYENWCQNKYISETTQHIDENLPIKIDSINIENSEGKIVKNIRRGDDIKVSINIKAREKKEIHIGVGFRSISGDNMFGVTTKADSLSSITVDNSKTIDVHFPKIQLINGDYQAFGVLLDEHALHIYDLKLSDSINIDRPSEVYGKIYMEHRWII